MERTLLKEEIKDITMPDEMRARIVENCRNAGLEKENIGMKIMDIEGKAVMDNSVVENETTEGMVQNKTRTARARKWPRIATVAAAVALCLGLGGVTVMASSGKLEGFFADVTRWDGAVVGMTYEQATEEIEVSVAVNDDSLVVDAVLLKAGEAPYAFLDSVGIQAYSVVNAEGETLVEGTSNEKTGITDGAVSIKLPLDELESGNYKLIITEFVGSAKAEQDLPMKGYWVCEFSL